MILHPPCLDSKIAGPLLFIFFITGSGLHGEEAKAVRFEGQVRERGTREPVSGALVEAAGIGERAVSDDEGRFVLSLPPGSFRLFIIAPSFEPVTRTILVEEGIRPLRFYLKRLAVDPYETVVVEEKASPEVSVKEVSREEIERMPATFGDVGMALHNLPGVARSNFDMGYLIVRASPPEDTVVYLDRARIPLLYHFGGITTVIPSDFVESAELYPGGFSARFGRSTGGILEVKTRDDFPDGIHAYSEIDLLDAGAFFAGSMGRFSLCGGARRSYVDTFLNLILPEEANFGLVEAPRYFDYQLKVKARFGPLDTFSAAGIGSNDRMVLLSGEGFLNYDPTLAGHLYTEMGFHRLIGVWERRAGTFNSLLSLSTGYDHQAFSFGPSFDYEASLVLNTLRWDMDKVLLPWLTLLAGVEGFYAPYDFTLTSPFYPLDFQTDPTEEAERFSLSGTGYGAGVSSYLEFSMKFKDLAEFIPGARLDYTALNTHPTYLNLDPRIIARFHLFERPALTLFATAGLYHQPPQPYEIMEGFGNPDLNQEYSHQYSTGLRLRMAPSTFLNIEAFYKELHDLVVYSWGYGEEGDSNYFENSGSGLVKGVELLLKHSPAGGNLKGWISYTLQKALLRDSPESEWYTSPFDQNHILTILSSYRFPEEIYLSMRFRFVSGEPYTPILSAVYDSDLDEYLPLPGDYYSEILPPFHSLDLRIERRFVFRLWILSLYLDIMNVYNRRNPEEVVYNHDYSSMRYVYGLPILPTIGMRGEF